MNIPFANKGVLIIERPLYAEKTNGHKVAYYGNIFPGVEQGLRYFAECLLLGEKFVASKDFLHNEAEETDQESWVNEILISFLS